MALPKLFRGLSLPMWVLYANVALYALCYQAQTPVLPSILKALTPDAKEHYAAFSAYFSALQLGGGLLSGVLIDTMGVERVLLLSFLASALSYGLMAIAVDSGWLQLVYVSQLPTVFQHAVMASRAFVVFLSPEEGHERATWMGYVSVAYGVGMVIGPSLGGYLSRFGLSLPAWAACAGSCVSALAAYLLLSGTAASAAKADGATSQPSRPWSSVLSHPALAGILAVKALATAASSVFQATFGLVGDERFGLDAQGMGFLLSIVGATGAVSSLLLVKPVTAAFAGRDGTLSMLLGGAMAALFATFSFVSTTEQLYALTVALTAVSTVFAVANSAALSRAVPLSLKGTAVAVDMALGSGARIFAPAVCATLLRTGGFASIGASASAVMAVMVGLIAVGAIRVDAPATPTASESGGSDEPHDAAGPPVKGKGGEGGTLVRKRSR